MRNEKIKNELQEVLNVVEDGARGYRHAAKNIDNDELKTIFNRLAQQRKMFREELENDARDMGADLDPDGSTKGYFHRKWMDVKSGLSSRKEHVLVEEAMRGEREAIKTYDHILRDNHVPDYIQERLEEQRRLVAGARTQLEEFERLSA